MKAKYIYLPLMTVLTLGTVGCNSDDEYFSEDSQKAPMQITKVYLEDYESAVPDREVEFGRLGQMLRLEGTGLYGVRKVEINGYETYFNRAYVTDNNLLVTLSGDTPVSTCPESIRNTIHLYKDGGNEYVYNFEIRAATPTFTSFSNTLPNAGEEVIIYGTDMQETSLVIMPDGSTITEGIKSDRDGEWFSFTMPAGMTAAGSIEAVNANGRIKTPACFNERRGMLLNFDGIGAMGSWGATYSTDDLEDDPLGTGRGKVAPLVPQSVIDEGGLQSGARSLYWGTGGKGTENDDWSAFTDLIPATTPVSDIAIQYDLYCPNPMSTGVIEITIINNLSKYGWNTPETNQEVTEFCNPHANAWIPWYENGTVEPFQTEGWITVTVPLNKIGRYQDISTAYTFDDVIQNRLAAENSNVLMLLVNSDISLSDDNTLEAKTYNQKIYIDNLRLVPYKTYKISDFPDEEEEEEE